VPGKVLTIETFKIQQYEKRFTNEPNAVQDDVAVNMFYAGDDL
jgi:hypothetical protein